MVSIEVPPEYGFVIFVNVFCSAIVMQVLGGMVGAARKKYGVKYPTMYAVPQSKPSKYQPTAISEDQANLFNCTQRAHQNPLETYQVYLASSLISGLVYPVPVAILGILYCIGRMSWALGYQTGDPMGRYKSSIRLGFLVWVGFLGVLLLTLPVAYKLVNP